GISGSVLDDPTQDSTPELRADDVAAILDAMGAESADLFGSSGGAVTGLALVARHPGRVRTLVAHEPPSVELLPDAAEQRAAVDDMIETFHRAGLEAAFAKFMGNAGFGEGDEGAPAEPPGEPSEQDLLDGAQRWPSCSARCRRSSPGITAGSWGSPRSSRRRCGRSSPAGEPEGRRATRRPPDDAAPVPPPGAASVPPQCHILATRAAAARPWA
ncbi:alpha/beta fold hydrolase, partial [Nonomuraea sp. KM90]|uniref:alpha/beta fold hydrolase n=1 Tax=Nonomuraea sp. KM90 TaxID=3457428 RepID=UPI003FCDFEE5